MAEVGPAPLVGTRIETRSYGYDVTLPSGRIVRLHETGIDFPPGMTPDEHMAILFLVAGAVRGNGRKQWVPPPAARTTVTLTEAMGYDRRTKHETEQPYDAVYVVRDAHGAPVYAGMTKYGVRRRLRWHAWSKTSLGREIRQRPAGWTVEILPCGDREAAAGLEAQTIRQLQPRLNQKLR